VINFKRHLQKRLPLLAGIIRRRGLGARVPDLEDRLQLAAVGEGVRAREHFHNQAAQGPDVGFAGVGSLLDDLGGHPEDGALQAGAVDVAAVFLGGEQRRGFDAFGDAEVGDLDVAFVVHEDVGAFDVPVDDVAAVEVRQPAKDLPDEVPDQRFLEGAVGIEHCGHRTTGHVFEENVEVLVVRVRAEVLHYVLVLQVAEEIDLAFESCYHGFLAFVEGGIAVGGYVDLLYSHKFTSNSVQGEEDAAEGALPDQSALHPFHVVPGVGFEELV